jgi:hypothetical protein
MQHIFNNDKLALHIQAKKQILKAFLWNQSWIKSTKGKNPMKFLPPEITCQEFTT